MRVLLVEDESSTTPCVEQILNQADIVVYTTRRREEAVNLAMLYDYDLVVLELKQPGMTGADVLRSLRKAGVETPVFMLSDSDDTQLKLRCFDFGADDYLINPFNQDELIARIHAIIRRSKGHSESVIQSGRITMDLDKKIVKADGKPVQLTRKEFQLLELLCLCKGRLLTKDMLLDHLYGGLDEPDARIVDVFICKLRKKLSAATDGENCIETIWGRGYKLRNPGLSSNVGQSKASAA